LLLFVAIIVMVVYNFQQQSTSNEALTINKVAADIQSGLVTRVTEDDNRLLVVYGDRTRVNDGRTAQGIGRYNREPGIQKYHYRD
jgi:hypothetical protein